MIRVLNIKKLYFFDTLLEKEMNETSLLFKTFKICGHFGGGLSYIHLKSAENLSLSEHGENDIFVDYVYTLIVRVK